MPQSTDIESKLRDRVDAFVDEISELVRRAAIEAVQAALTGEAADLQRGAPRRAPGRKKAAKRTKRAASGRRRRRSAEDLDRLAKEFMDYVRSNPGRRLEEIGAALGTDTAELKRPVQRLQEAGKLRTTGQRRGTKYFAGRGRATRKASKKKRKTAKKKKKATAKRKRAKTSRRKATSGARKRGVSARKLLPGKAA